MCQNLCTIQQPAFISTPSPPDCVALSMRMAEKIARIYPRYSIPNIYTKDSVGSSKTQLVIEKSGRH